MVTAAGTSRTSCLLFVGKWCNNLPHKYELKSNSSVNFVEGDNDYGKYGELF